MSLDYTKPVYGVCCFDSMSLTNDLNEAVKKASQNAKQDRDGDDYFVMQAIKRASAPVTDVNVTDYPTA